MKKIKNLIKLTNLSSEHLEEKELRVATGGDGICICGCYYCDCGGSSYSNNQSANADFGGVSPLPSPGYEWGMCI